MFSLNINIYKNNTIICKYIVPDVRSPLNKINVLAAKNELIMEAKGDLTDKFVKELSPNLAALPNKNKKRKTPRIPKLMYPSAQSGLLTFRLPKFALAATISGDPIGLDGQIERGTQKKAGSNN